MPKHAKEQERLRLEREAQKREEAAERRRKLQESIGVSKEEAEKAEAIRSLRHVRKDAETSEEDIELAAKAAQGQRLAGCQVQCDTCQQWFMSKMSESEAVRAHAILSSYLMTVCCLCKFSSELGDVV